MSSILEKLPPCGLRGVDRFRQDAKHPPIEAIKKSVYEGYDSETEGRPLRGVRIVHRSTTSVDEQGHPQGLQRYVKMRSLLHWALQIENSPKFFELRLDKINRRQVTFVCREWQEHHYLAARPETLESGHTLMNDEEILAIGTHLLSCWAMEYSKLGNSCQLLLNEVLSHILMLPYPGWNRSLTESYFYRIFAANPALFLSRLLRIIPKEKQQRIFREYFRRVLPHDRNMVAEARVIYQKLQDDLTNGDSILDAVCSAWVDYLVAAAKGMKDANEDIAGTIFRKTVLDKLWITPLAYAGAPILATEEVCRNLATIGGKRLYKATKQGVLSAEHARNAHNLTFDHQRPAYGDNMQSSKTRDDVYRGYNKKSIDKFVEMGFSRDAVVDVLEEWEISNGGGAEFCFSDEDTRTIIDTLRQRVYADL